MARGSKHLGYPNTPLKEPVRKIDQTQSVFEVIRKHFFRQPKDNPQ